jgi:hypothetical protein
MELDLHTIDISNILFLDIETVPQYAVYIDVPEKDRRLWDVKSKRLQTANERPSVLYKKAGIFAEFGKIICISVAYVVSKKNQPLAVRVRSFYGDNEREILEQFLQLITKHFNTTKHYLCAHNGIEFDFPFIARRALIHGLALPKTLDTRGKRPWDIRHLDTLDLWRFGDYKNYTSLELLTHIFDIPTPKDDIDGSMICDLYWKENDFQRIVEYCQKDVVAVLQLLRKYRNEPLFEQQSITIVS